MVVDATRATPGEFPVVVSAVESDTTNPQVAAFVEEAFGTDPVRLTLRYREFAVTEGDDVYVLGWATERDGEVTIAPPEPGGTFLVSAG